MKEYSYGVVPVYTHDTEDLYLLIQHHAGHWAFPKGHAEKDETALQTAARELVEETGIRACEVREDISFQEHYPVLRHDKQVRKTVRYFLGIVKDKHVRIQKEELLAYEWLHYHEARKRMTFDESKHILDKAKHYLDTHRP